MRIVSAYNKLPWLEIILAVILISVNIYAAGSDPHNLPNKWFTRDDAYYYFKVAQNISEGLGSTFDGINPTNGYHPLWLLVCIPIFSLARFDLILPLRILIIILAVLRISTSVLLYRFLKQSISIPIAAAAAFYWAFDYNIHLTVYQQGLETGLAAFSLVLFLYVLGQIETLRKNQAFTKSHLGALALFAILFVFSRLDMIFLAGIFGVWIVFRGQPARYLLLVDLLIFTVSLAGALIIRVGLPEFYQYRDFILFALALSLWLKFPVFFLMGLYDLAKITSVVSLLKRELLAIVISATVLFGALLLTSGIDWVQGNIPRSVPIIDAAIALVLSALIRMAVMYWRTKRTSTQQDIHFSMTGSKLLTLLRSGLIYYGILGGAIGLYMLWNKITFGTSTPVSGQIKRWWGSFASKVYGGSARTPLSFFGIDSQGDFSAWAPLTTSAGEWHRKFDIPSLPFNYDVRYLIMLFTSLIILGVILILLDHKRLIHLSKKLALVPLFVGAEFQILSYNLTGYSALKEWYWVTQLVWLALAACLVADILTKPIRKYRLGYIFLAGLSLYWGLSIANYSSRITIRQMEYMQPASGKPLMESAAFIENHTEPGSLIGMTGGGNVGYFIQNRTVINMDGLINSHPYFIANKAEKGSDFLASIGMKYIFANPDFLDRQPYRGQYTDRVDVIDYYGGKAIMRFFPIGSPQPN